MSMAVRIYAAAKEAFGVPGVYKAWPMVSEAYEDLILRRFNRDMGPLNDKQLQILEDSVLRSIDKAKDAPNVYASFRWHMNALLTDPALNARIGMNADRREVELPEEMVTLRELPPDE